MAKGPSRRCETSGSALANYAALPILAFGLTFDEKGMMTGTDLHDTHNITLHLRRIEELFVSKVSAFYM